MANVYYSHPNKSNCRCMSFEEGHQFLKDLWPDHFTSPSSFGPPLVSSPRAVS